MPPALQFLVLTFAGWVNRHQDDLIAYLREENRVLREHLASRPLRRTDAQRRRLAVRGQKLGRRVLMQVAGIVTPDTILRWYRRLIAQTYDGSARRGRGRPMTRRDVAALVVRMAVENPQWGYTRIRGALSNLGHEIASDHGEADPARPRDRPGSRAEPAPALVVDRLYDSLKAEDRGSVLPLVADVADPSPGLGWRGLERRPLADRGAPDLILCLALAHHVVIGRNVPLADFVAWLAGFGAEVVVEIVDREDPMVERLLRNRCGQAIEYSDAAARELLTRHFGAVTHETMASGTRTLYHCLPRSGDAPRASG